MYRVRDTRFNGSTMKIFYYVDTMGNVCIKIEFKFLFQPLENLFYSFYNHFVAFAYT